MATQLNTIVLIDDDEATNFIHRRIIKLSGCTEKIVVFQDAKKALSYLKTSENGSFPAPDLIFLDINMPGMNGWEFMQVYAELPEEQRGKVVVMMLTTSLNPDDRMKAESIADITGFLSKPLTKEVLMGIVEERFG